MSATSHAALFEKKKCQDRIWNFQHYCFTMIDYIKKKYKSDTIVKLW